MKKISKNSPRATQKSSAKKTQRPTPAQRCRVEEIFTRFSKASPNPKGELYYTNPFTLLVAVVLSAQATDVGVNKATHKLFTLADTPEKILELGEARLKSLIQTIGLFRTKAKHIMALCQVLVNEYGSQTPQSREALMSLPGVGRKTANVVMNIAFHKPTIAVDTHIFRLSNRLPLAPGKTPQEVEDGLMGLIPERFLLHAHHWLILHGRYVCKARRPECDHCIIFDLCNSKEKKSNLKAMVK
jgi:endonuclease-3